MRQVQLELLLEQPLPIQQMMLHLKLRPVQGMLLMRMKLPLELLPRMRGLQLELLLELPLPMQEMQQMMLHLKLRQEQGMLLSMKMQRKLMLQGLQQRLLMEPLGGPLQMHSLRWRKRPGSGRWFEYSCFGKPLLFVLRLWSCLPVRPVRSTIL